MVVTFHRVVSHPDYEDPLKVSVLTFEQQINFLEKNFRIISASDFETYLINGHSSLEGTCLITFDDGWRDNYTHAFPVLKQLKVPALFFLTTDYVGTRKTFWPERLGRVIDSLRFALVSEKSSLTFSTLPQSATEQLRGVLSSTLGSYKAKTNDLINHLKQFDPEMIHDSLDQLAYRCQIQENGLDRSMMTWEEVQEMAQHGMEFGSHTKSHAILTQIRKECILEELRGSKETIESILRRPVKFISYPNGDHNDFVIQKTEEAGYLAAFSCLPGINPSLTNRYALRRKHLVEYYSLGIRGAFGDSYFRADLSDIRERLRQFKIEILNYI